MQYTTTAGLYQSIPLRTFSLSPRLTRTGGWMKRGYYAYATAYLVTAIFCTRPVISFGIQGQIENQRTISNIHSSKFRKHMSTSSFNSRKEDSSMDEEPRTGWLHNTEPKWLIEQREKQEAALQKQSDAGYHRGQRYYSSNHRIISSPAFHACGEGRVVVVTEHMLSVPLNRNSDDTPVNTSNIDIFFTIAETVDENDEEFFKKEVMTSCSPEERALAYLRHSNLQNMDDAIIYLQGGPGFGAPTPAVGIGLSAKSSWVGEAFSKGFKRVILMDQRGTGRSTTLTKQTLERRFPDLFKLDDKVQHDSNDTLEDLENRFPEEVAVFRDALNDTTYYLSNFRADNIVIDAEAIREALLVPSTNPNPRPWGAVLGQSFGGFCVMTYLSTIPAPPKVCLLTGGIAPMMWHVDKVYDSLWERVKERNLQYYDHYPEDIGVVKRIVRALLDKPATLPSGGKLTARRFLQLGLGLGGSPSSFASLHALFSSAFVDEQYDDFSRAFLKAVDSWQSFDDHPIYFLMHESIYADGGAKYADGSNPIPTQWSAHRMFEKRVKTPSEFSYKLTANLNSDARPTLFFGEMVFPWMADGDYAECSGVGMKQLANSLATKSDWGPLYNADQMRQALATSSKAAAAVYYDDLYVDFNACMDVTKRGGPLEKCKVWVTNEYQHSGIRDGGGTIFARLLGMAKGEIRIPS